jgi:diaminopimelate decarboxylase
MDAFNVRDGHPVAGAAPFAAHAPRFDLPTCATGELSCRLRNPAPEEGDLLAVPAVGAYGFVMNSNYNTRCRAAEVLADRSAVQASHRRGPHQERLASVSLQPD